MELWQSALILLFCFGIIIYAGQVYGLKRKFILNMWIKNNRKEVYNFDQNVLCKFWGRMLVALAVCVFLILVGIFAPLLVCSIIGGILFVIISILIVTYPDSNKKRFFKKG